MSAWRDVTGGSVLCVKSPMGTGKSSVVERALKMFNNVLIVTPRVSLAQQLYKDFKKHELQIYSHLEPEHKHLVCQFDSLKYVDLQKYQCVIFDEIMTLTNHIIGTCAVDGFADNFAKFCSIMASNRKLLLLDAMLIRGILDIVDPKKVKKLFWVENKWRDETPINIHSDANSFWGALFNCVEECISISCASTKVQKSLFNFFSKNGKAVRSISSEMTPEEINKAITDYNAGLYEVLIYSPTLSVGVNITRSTERHFHYDPGTAIDAVQSAQMIKRVRHAKIVDVYTKETPNHFKTDINDIKEQIRGSDLSAYISYNENGDRELNGLGNFYAYITRIYNIIGNEHIETINTLLQANYMYIYHVSSKSFINYASFFLDGVSKAVVDTAYESKKALGERYELALSKLDEKEVKPFLNFFRHKRCLESPAYLEETLADMSPSEVIEFNGSLETFKVLLKRHEAGKDLSTKSKQVTVEKHGIYGVETSWKWFKRIVRFKPKFVNLYDEIVN